MNLGRDIIVIRTSVKHVNDAKHNSKTKKTLKHVRNASIANSLQCNLVDMVERQEKRANQNLHKYAKRKKKPKG